MCDHKLEAVPGGFRVRLRLGKASIKPKPAAKQVPTFRKFGESWTSGELHKLYPDQVPLKRTAVDDASRLDRYV